MKRFLLPLLVLPLSACATGLAGPVLGNVLGNVLNRGGYGQGGPDFQTAAVEACGAEAARYGRVQVTNVEAASRSTLRVYGTVEANYRRHAFACSYREDGRITDFDIG